MFYTIGISKILHGYLCYVHNMWKNDKNFPRIFPRFLPVLYTIGICKILHWYLCYVHNMWKKNRIFLEYFRVFYPCFTQEESSRFWKVDTTSIIQGGAVNYQPVLHQANLVENLCFVCWVCNFTGTTLCPRSSFWFYAHVWEEQMYSVTFKKFLTSLL